MHEISITICYWYELGTAFGLSHIVFLHLFLQRLNFRSLLARRTFGNFFKDDTCHCIAPVHGYMMPDFDSIPLCTYSSFTFHPPSPPLQFPYKVLQFAGQSSTAIAHPTVVLWALFFFLEAYCCRLLSQKGKMDVTPVTLNSCQLDLNWDSFLFSLGTPAIPSCCGGCL